MTIDHQPSPLAAVVFDFDGVIVDTEPIHCEAFGRVLAPMGLAFTWDEYKAHYLGFDDRDAFREAYRRRGRAPDESALPSLIAEKAKAFAALVEERGARPYPGAVALIRGLAGRVPLALCSGALRRDVEPILRRLGVDRLFDALVTADDVEASKPDPASYVLAVERLAKAFPGRVGVASRCVAIEDTPAGIEAARGAGLKVLALSNSYPPGRLGAADRVVTSLEGLDPTELNGMVTA